MNDGTMIGKFESESGLPTGTRFEHHGVTFELGSILRMDSSVIVYKARNVLTGYCEHILKLYRSNLSEEELAQKWASHRQCANIVGDTFLEGGFFHIGEWTVILQHRSFEATSSTRRALSGNRGHSSFDDDWEEIAKFCDTADFAQAVQKCEAGLQKSPRNPSFLRLKGIALLGMGEGRAANDVLDLCFQMSLHDVELYVAVIRDCAHFGQAVWTRKWASVGISRVSNPRLLYKTWFEAEVKLEHVQLARMCLRQLRLLEEPNDSLEELSARLEELQTRLTHCAQDIDDAFRLLEQGQLEEAAQIADRLLKAYPHHVPAMFLASVWAMDQERWTEAIHLLRYAFIHDPLGNAEIPHLLGHAYRKLGKFEHAAIMQAVHEQLRNDVSEFVMGQGESRK